MLLVCQPTREAWGVFICDECIQIAHQLLLEARQADQERLPSTREGEHQPS
ncbi:MAG: hypothetical protein IVW57_11965 [Ktedonobacterales bacterium]|nr:hypothetical protein [Ktedonobacterales bacterium]